MEMLQTRQGVCCTPQALLLHLRELWDVLGTGGRRDTARHRATVTAAVTKVPHPELATGKVFLDDQKINKNGRPWAMSR